MLERVWWQGALAALCLGLSVGCGNKAEEPGTFTGIYAMLFPTNTDARCNFCHSMPASEKSNGHLHMGMDKSVAHAALVGKTSSSAKCMGRTYVVPYQPEMSFVLQKLSGSPPCGDRMPVGGSALSEAQLEMIRSWIANGAKDD